MLEYSQWLHNQQRNVCCDSKQVHVGTWLWLQAVLGGNQACGLLANGIAVGCSSQVIELHPESMTAAENTLDGWVFSDRVKALTHSL